jgi:serine/threonine protein kinase
MDIRGSYVTDVASGSLGRRSFDKVVHKRELPALETDDRMYNLSPGYWVYDELLADLTRAGWNRFGPGFKAGVYGHPKSDSCIKLLGMGVGDNPRYFCERGYYLEHERKMLDAFRRRGCNFAPSVLSQQDSVTFLREHGVRPSQAEIRVEKNDLLVMEYIPGIALATQTGHHLNYDVNVDAFDEYVLTEMISALQRLRVALQRANSRDLVHNDPMPPNIVFTERNGSIEAMLVDFEIAQDLRVATPEYVVNTVAELYAERGVPWSSGTARYDGNLDMVLLGKSIEVMEWIRDAVASHTKDSVWDTVNLRLPLVGGASVNLGRAFRYIRSRLS